MTARSPRVVTTAVFPETTAAADQRLPLKAVTRYSPGTIIWSERIKQGFETRPNTYRLREHCLVRRRGILNQKDSKGLCLFKKENENVTTHSTLSGHLLPQLTTKGLKWPL